MSVYTFNCTILSRCNDQLYDVKRTHQNNVIITLKGLIKCIYASFIKPCIYLSGGSKFSQFLFRVQLNLKNLNKHY